MSSPSQMQPAAPAKVPDLASLRVELDRLDDALHNTLMRRAEVVKQVAALRVKGPVPLRPGREAAIIRRLLARHDGGLPAFGIVRIWRELLGTTTAQQHPLVVSVCEAGGDAAYLALAREHFGALTPMRLHRSPAEAMDEVRAGRATVAVLPMPAEGEAASDAWWTALFRPSDPRVHVVARLPFWSPRPEGTPTVQGMVVSAAAPDPSGEDRSLLGLDVANADRVRLDAALAAAGFRAGPVIMRGGSGAPAPRALAEVDGFVGDDDPRLAMLREAGYSSMVLGAYAVPVGGDT
jgi:chorismate mutase/prephenate dehydratase